MGGCFQPGKPQGEFGHKVSMSTQTSYIPGEPFTQRCKIGMSPLPTAVIVAGFHIYIYIYMSLCDSRPLYTYLYQISSESLTIYVYKCYHVFVGDLIPKPWWWIRSWYNNLGLEGLFLQGMILRCGQTSFQKKWHHIRIQIRNQRLLPKKKQEQWHQIYFSYQEIHIFIPVIFKRKKPNLPFSGTRAADPVPFDRDLRLSIFISLACRWLPSRRSTSFRRPTFFWHFHKSGNTASHKKSGR